MTKTWIIVILGFIILMFICFRGCNSSVTPTSSIKEIRLIDTLKIVDTLIVHKTITRTKEIERLKPYEHIIYVPTYILHGDTSLQDSLQALALSQSKVIKQDDSLFILHSKKDSLNIKIIAIKDNKIDSLTDQTHEKGWIKPFCKGVITGIAISKGIDLILKVK